MTRVSIIPCSILLRPYSFRPSPRLLHGFPFIIFILLKYWEILKLYYGRGRDSNSTKPRDDQQDPIRVLENQQPGGAAKSRREEPV